VASFVKWCSDIWMKGSLKLDMINITENDLMFSIKMAVGNLMDRYIYIYIYIFTQLLSLC